ncbi:MAG TPA: BamA/TamA family outer membrane protein [Gemmatimonadaceae bacterium]|nr:BamA/TamA family outer membrane protein [Gemmatimonadaceae bacterium]
MECPRKGWLSGVAALMLLLPGVVSSQTPPTASKEPPKTEVDRLIFKGVKSVDRKDLTLSLYTEPSHCVSLVLTPLCWLTHAHYVYARHFLNHEELQRDVLRAEVYYWKRGFRETLVDTLVDKKGDHHANVTFLVNEGPPTIVSDISVSQSKPVLSAREISDRLVLEEKHPLNLLRLDSTVVFLSQRLWEKGYADALVDTNVVIDTATKTATVGIDLNPRWIATVSDIIIEGNKQVDTRTILKSMRLHPGAIFRRSDLLRSQRALYESNLFKRASIDIPRQGDSSKVLIVNVTEAPLREARFSGGFNTIDFFQVEGRFMHYSFLGRARRLELQAAVGNLFARSLNGRFIFRDAMSGVIDQRSRYFAPTYNASINFRQPWFGSADNELGLSVFGHRRSAPGIYIDKGFGTSATFTREVLERAPVSLNYRFELNRVDAGDVYFCINFGICDQSTLGALRERHRLSPLTLTGSINRANDPLAPTKGYRATADLEHASSFTVSDFRYNRASADAATYYPVRKRGVIAGHVRLGWIHPLRSTGDALDTQADDLLHPRKRFYAGGSRSVRGFAENQLGPRVLTIPNARLRRKDPGCTEDVDITLCDPNAPDISRLDFEPRPLGGNIVAETSAEFRFPVWRQIMGAAFIDAGYVAQRQNPDLPKSKAAITPGFGVRYLSPVGPIRIDFGVNPGRTEDLPVVTETTVNGRTALVRLQKKRNFDVVAGKGGFLDRLQIHLSIGEAF